MASSRALLVAADRMADWITARHSDAHDIVSRELGVDDSGEECEGCLRVASYLKLRAEEKDAVE